MTTPTKEAYLAASDMVSKCAQTLAVVAQLEDMARYLGTHEQSIKALQAIKIDIGSLYATNLDICERYVQ